MQSANQAFNAGPAVPAAGVCSQCCSRSGRTCAVLRRRACQRRLGMCVHLLCFWSLSAAHGELGWQGPQRSTALQVIGGLTTPPTLAPLLSQVCRTQIQRYQRASMSERGPAGSSRPLRSPSLTWSGGWTRLWLSFAARLFLGIATDGRCRERAGCGAGTCRGTRRGTRWCRQLGPGPLLACWRCLPAFSAASPHRRPRCCPAAGVRVGCPWRG